MAKETKERKKSVHAGHRERMLKKYHKLGADAFEPHELLEMLLYFSIRQHNTNETAHNVIDSLGSVSEIFSAKTNDGTLTKIKGIGPKSAELLELARDNARSLELYHSASAPLHSQFQRTRYIYNWFKGKAPGTVMAMYLDEEMMLTEAQTLSAGRRFRPEVYHPVIVDRALEIEAKYVIICHSHSNNSPEPSAEDLWLAGRIRSALGAHGIELLNQYIVTEFDCIPTNNFNN